MWTMEGATGISAITSALVSGLTTAGENVMSAIASVLPVALTIVGAVLVVTIGVRVFKMIAHK